MNTELDQLLDYAIKRDDLRDAEHGYIISMFPTPTTATPAPEPQPYPAPAQTQPQWLRAGPG